MSHPNLPQDPKHLNQAVHEAWEQNAAWWDEQVGEGNLFQRVLIGPATERLLDLQPGETVLDVACGNGHFSRRMAQLGANVVACDFSATFLERARARTAENIARIEYHQVDATDEAQLLALGRGRFDAAVCTMALMDMAEIDPLMRALPGLLKPGGRFVFSVTHPCFNHTATKRIIEEEDRDGEMIETHSVRVFGYAHPKPTRGLGIIGQPAAHIYFDRPLHELFGAAFRAGLVLDGLEEPVFTPAESSQRPLGWANFKEIPQVLVARMRVLGA